MAKRTRTLTRSQQRQRRLTLIITGSIAVIMVLSLVISMLPPPM